MRIQMIWLNGLKFKIEISSLNLVILCNKAWQGFEFFQSWKIPKGWKVSLQKTILVSVIPKIKPFSKYIRI